MEVSAATKMLNVFYIHSPICWEASLLARKYYKSEPYILISARHYKTPTETAYHINYDCFFNLHNAAALGIEFNQLLRRFLSPEHDSARLFIPHATGPVLQLLGSHTLVKEIYFLEEGDLAYTETYRQHPTKIPSHFKRKGCMDVAALLSKHRFDSAQVRDTLENFYCDMLFNLHGKLHGVCKFDGGAFKKTPGRHIIGKLGCRFETFSENSLLLLPAVTDPSCSKWVEDRRQELELTINSIAHGFIFKKHPACDISDYPPWLASYLKNGTNWADVAIFQDGQREISQFRFKRVYILGMSSAARYFRLTQPDTPIALFN